MSNFTQGPWVAKGGEVCTEEYEADGQIMHDHICCCEVINGDSPNAILIAAAPELLEALQCLKRELVLSDVDLAYIESHFRPHIDRASAAIKKALGQ